MALIKIKSDARPDLGYILIEPKDYNPSLHELYKEVVEVVNEPSPVVITPTVPYFEQSELVVDEVISTSLEINNPDLTIQDLTALDGVGKSTAEQIISLRSQNPLTLEILQAKFPRIKWGELNLIF